MLCRFCSWITSIFALQSMFKCLMKNSAKSVWGCCVWVPFLGQAQFLLSSEIINNQQCVWMVQISGGFLGLCQVQWWCLFSDGTEHSCWIAVCIWTRMSAGLWTSWLTSPKCISKNTDEKSKETALLWTGMVTAVCDLNRMVVQLCELPCVCAGPAHTNEDLSSLMPCS